MRLFKKLLAASALSLAAIVPDLSMAAAPAPVSAGYAVGPQRLAATAPLSMRLMSRP